VKPCKWMAALPLLACALAASPAPDEQELGKSDGYPYQRLSPDFSLMAERYKVGNFTQMERIFWPREIAAPPQARPLQPPTEPWRLTYDYNGKTYTVEDLLARQRITGLLVLKGDQIVYEAYQYERNGQHKFASFSMAKTVVSLLVGIALQEGRIASLDDPAEKYAPELKNTAYGPVSLRQLLRMSSGARWSDKAFAGQPTDIAELSADTYFRRGRGAAFGLKRVRESVAAPGTAFNYSSAETLALSLALRGAVGTDLTAYATEKLWKPMGAEAPGSWLTDITDVEAGFCCINARLRDYGRLGLLLAADGEVDGRQVVPREFLLDGTDATRQPEYLKPRKATPYLGYGYQAWLYPFRTRTFEARGLFGQQLIVQPSSKVVIVITSALKTPDVPGDVFVERNYFIGAVLKSLGGQADVYR
jgi:CubicO group peptidase (beta-lactamase class C family)